MIRDGLVETVTDLFRISVVGFAASENEAAPAMRTMDWDVALLDLLLKQGPLSGCYGAAVDRRAVTALDRQHSRSGAPDAQLQRSLSEPSA